MAKVTIAATLMEIAEDSRLRKGEKVSLKLIAAEVKKLLKLVGDKDHPEHYCHICGGKNIVWYVVNELWNKVVADLSLICCPLCFVKLAEKKGLKPTAWRLSQECDSPEVDELRTEVARLKELLREIKEEPLAAMKIRSTLKTGDSS